MILDRLFERIVIISLDTPQGRTRSERAISELRAKSLSEKANIFAAIDGSSLQPPAWWPSGAGAWGCQQSHYRLVQDAYRDGVESLLLIEDDAIWQENASDLIEEFMSQVPDDWGQIYFGGQHRSSTRPKWFSERPAVVAPYSVHRTHCYAIKRATMVKFLQHIMHAPDYIEAAAVGKRRHIDHQLEEAHKRGDWKVYAPSYWIAGQGENLSGINHKSWPDQWWHLPWKDAHEGLPVILIDRTPTPDEAKRLHIGNHPRSENIFVDDGIFSAESQERLISIVNVISLEAYKSQRLPAVFDLPEKIEWLISSGKTLIPLSQTEDLAMLADLSRSKLIVHPWLNPSDSTPTEIEEMTQSERSKNDALGINTVHQIWIGTKQIPERLLGYAGTIRHRFRDWTYKLWTDSDLPYLAVNAILPDVILSEKYPLGLRVDVIRLEILRQFGGVYFDIDFEALSDDLPAVLEKVQGFAYGDEVSGRPSNAFMAAANPFNAFIEFYLRKIESSLRIPDDIMEVVSISGPDKLASALNAWVEEWGKNKPFMFEGKRIGSTYSGGSITGFWREFFYPYGYFEGTFATFNPENFPNALAAHHWEGSWHRDKK